MKWNQERSNWESLKAMIIVEKMPLFFQSNLLFTRHLMLFVPVYLGFVFFVIPLSYLWNIFSLLFPYLSILCYHMIMTWNNIIEVENLDAVHCVLIHRSSSELLRVPVWFQSQLRYSKVLGKFRLLLKSCAQVFFRPLQDGKNNIINSVFKYSEIAINLVFQKNLKGCNVTAQQRLGHGKNLMWDSLKVQGKAFREEYVAPVFTAWSQITKRETFSSLNHVNSDFRERQ